MTRAQLTEILAWPAMGVAVALFFVLLVGVTA